MTLLLLSVGVDPGTVTYKQADFTAFRKLEKAVDKLGSGGCAGSRPTTTRTTWWTGTSAACVSAGQVMLRSRTLDNESLRFR